MFLKHTAPYRQKIFSCGNGNGNGKKQEAGKQEARPITEKQGKRLASPYKPLQGVFDRGAIYCKGRKRGDFSGIYSRLSA